MPLGIIIVGVVVAVALALWLCRRILFDGWSAPIALTKGDVYKRDLLIGIAVAVSILVGTYGRAQLRSEREARVNADIASLEDRTLTRQQVAGIAQALIRLREPTTSEQLVRINRALKTCATHRSCRVAFVQTVNRIVRSPAGKLFTPAPRDGGAPPVSPGKTVVVQGKPGPIGAPGMSGAMGKQGAPGKPGGPGQVNSNVVDGLDNRVADLEGALQSLVSHVQVLDKLVNVLCRLLTPSRC